MPANSFPARHLIAVTALVSGVVALYLHLWKLGLAGTLACGGSGGCAAVQFSPWSWFLGVDVALIGTIGYTLILVTALLGIAPSRIDDRRWTIALAALIIPAFIFTLRLKYYEFFVMKTFCPWCAISAVTITLHMVLVGLDWRRLATVGDSRRQ
ncbi:MAG TPA: vitamin K epoxide reductase family protein [Gemmatimonadales bacterium]|nr:vitamin K epoxide reductase family protein [Gemmatimonadales bacterium]